MQVRQAVIETIGLSVHWLINSITGQVLIAAAVVVIGWYIASLTVRLLGRPVAQRFERQSLSRTILRTVKLVIVLFSIAIAIGILPIGIGIGNVFLSVTVVSAVIGVTLAPLVGNYVDGLFVLMDRPYEIGDMIEIVEIEQRGFITDVTLRSTKILTQENTLLVISNTTIRERDVINYSAEDERTWETLDIMVTYEGDLAQARRLMIQAARNVDGVISGGPTIRIGPARYPTRPTCLINEYADNGIELRLRYWVQNPYYLGGIRSQIQERIWEAVDDADVEFPYPHTHVTFDDNSGDIHMGMNRREPEPSRLGFSDRQR